MGDRWFMAYILNNLAELAIIRQDYESARQSCQTSFAIREEFNDLEGMAVALNHLSQIDLRQEDYTQAQRTFERSLQLYQEINDIGGLATSYGGLAYAALALGEFDTARGHYTRALLLAADIWYTAVFPDLLLGIGQLLCRTGHVERGLALFAHVRHDGAASYDAQSRAALLLDSFKLSASPQRFAAAEKAGRQATLETTVKELLIELPLLNLSAAINAAAANDGSAANQALVEPLTPRELEVLSLMAGGLSNQEIADELVLALGTVKYYTRQIYGKLQVNNRVRALAVAQGLGLI
jgi:DNA-binding CsgD family transcriptional regulator